MDPVRLTEEFVAFDTVSTRPNEPLCARLDDLLQGLGGHTERILSPDHEGQVNLLARFGPDRPGGLAFAGHTDTVPWDGTMRATTAPERDGRRLYGRGTCDMKGAIASMIVAAHAVGRDGLRGLNKPLWMAFTFEEEIGCHGAKLLDAVRPLPVDHIVIGEPTGLRPVTRHKGYVVGRVEVSGVPCHSSDPTQGASAIHGAARAVDALLAMAEGWRSQTVEGFEPPWPSLNVGILQAGTARNVVPDRASFTVEMRPMPGQRPEDLFDAVEVAVAAAVATVPGVQPLGWRLERVESNEPLGTAEDAPLVAWLTEQTGRSPGSVPFYTEAAILARKGATSCVCGPGEIAQAHRVDEYVDLDALEEAAILYRGAIEQFCL
jgi:acetylornithine deacetylase